MSWFHEVPWTNLLMFGSATLIAKRIPEGARKAAKDSETMSVKGVRGELLVRAGLTCCWIYNLGTGLIDHNLSWAPWALANLVDDGARMVIFWKGYRPAIAREVLEG